MKNLQTRISTFLFFIFVVCMHASSVSAEELYRQFSLGVGSLTSAPADTKDPEPGVVTAKYGFKIAKDFIPYMGTGLAYSYQPNSWTGDMTNVKTGVAAQLGFTYLIGTGSTLKLDYKYLSLPPEQSHGDLKTAPQSIGIGLDIKF